MFAVFKERRFAYPIADCSRFTKITVAHRSSFELFKEEAVIFMIFYFV